MKTLVLQSKSEANLKLLGTMAKKIGVEVQFITAEEFEDTALLNAMEKGRTKKYINTEKFIQKLKK